MKISKLVFLLSLVSSLLSPVCVHAAVHTQDVEYKDGDTVLEGFLAYEDTLSGPHPGVLVVHEWKGLNAYAKKRAEQLAQLGYVAFAVDMYGKGVRPETPEAAGAEAGKYKKDRALMQKRARAGYEVLAGHPLVDPQRMAVIGYCFGGTAALELARSGAGLKGAVSFHGGLSNPNPENAANITGKTLVLHGAADPHVPPQEVEAFKKEMDAAGKELEFITYEGAVHGFTNSDNGQDASTGAAYNEEADIKSWMAMRRFFEEIFSS